MNSTGTSDQGQGRDTPGGNLNKPTDKRTGQRAPCQHVCRSCKDFTTRGSALSDHQGNRNIHKDCHSDCPGYIYLSGKAAENKGSAHNKRTNDSDERKNDKEHIPEIPLRILMVLPSDFDHPTTIGRNRTYEMTIPFAMDAKLKAQLNKYIPGFLKHSKYKAGTLQTNAWLMLFYFIVDGDLVGDDDGRSRMSGVIVSYDQFLRMDQSEQLSFDLIMGSLVGKGEMGGSEAEILRFWKDMEELEAKIPFWPCLKEQQRYYGKIQTESDLDHIAQSVTNTMRPFWTDVPPNEGHFVAKRTHSADSNHVVEYTPGMVLQNAPPAKWFFQRWNPLITSVGEVKVTVVNQRRVLGRVLCKPIERNNDAITTETVRWIHPLDKLGTLDNNQISLFNDTAAHGPDIRGLEELDAFCVKTLQHLSRIERTRQTEPLSIDALARVDVALWRREDGRLDYYVNEISRGTACGLMEHLATETTSIAVMASSVREGLIKSFLQHCKMYPAIPRRHVIPC
ncbi:hypothetical protein LshimejAT787_3700070 [Lyophyllum shimeji]|uniref:Uncharacterized protein n=1 Tax=Lyophyllum shimeji TaxID=47721 RepID=A0A9P3Q2F4_LYOSH|nr:hypothetical protein LshimejAT787_2200890 [Lyophyllum shimeji]GLB45839.1 hypothetical protein LshimejAT787_3200100 [Lyophyllum shimeji]GLB45904.1 hypothetical protein LshimejAT787_3700070 [Lyophyllum shimeji]